MNYLIRGFVGVLTLLVTAAPALATTYIYNAQGDGVSPGTLPTAQGWTLNAGGGSSDPDNSQTISGLPSSLVVYDDDPFDRGFYYSTNHFGVAVNPSSGGAASFFQMRSMVRLLTNAVSPAFGGGNPTDVALYLQLLTADDTPRAAGFGIRYNPAGAGSLEFSIGQISSDTPISIPYDPSAFYEVVLTKPASAGSTVNMTLEVFKANSLGASHGAPALGTTTFNYGGVNDFAGGPDGLYFGNVNGGAPTGTFELKWATFGIGEAAPELLAVPEPSIISLITLGALLGMRKLRRISAPT